MGWQARACQSGRMAESAGTTCSSIRSRVESLRFEPTGNTAAFAARKAKPQGRRRKRPSTMTSKQDVSSPRPLRAGGTRRRSRYYTVDEAKHSSSSTDWERRRICDRSALRCPRNFAIKPPLGKDNIPSGHVRAVHGPERHQRTTRHHVQPQHGPASRYRSYQSTLRHDHERNCN